MSSSRVEKRDPSKNTCAPARVLELMTRGASWLTRGTPRLLRARARFLLYTSRTRSGRNVGFSSRRAYPNGLHSTRVCPTR